MQMHAVRLRPGDDLKAGIEAFVEKTGITAGALVSAVGSLEVLKLRLAGATPDHQPMLERIGEFEIVSITGTVSENGSHIHVAVSDETGTTLGGHLKNGCIIRTTAEIVIVADPDQTFRRTLDPATGFDEFDVS